MLLEGVDAAYLALIVAQVQAEIEADLGDTFEPPNPDNDITLELQGSGSRRLYIPRRVRSVTTVKTRDEMGVLTTQASTYWRLTSSVSASPYLGGVFDYIDVTPGQYLAGAYGYWPYGPQTVQVIGKFGWATTPPDIKRLTALLVYDFLKPSGGHLRKATRLNTQDATYTFANAEDVGSPIPEAERIMRRYRRQGVMVA